MRSAFVWFGGKSKVAPVVWRALGDVDHYVEPFFGSGAVLLSRPHPAKCETVNDADGLLANFWRAVARDPEAVARHATNPVNEADLHARHLWLVNAKDGLTDRLMGDPDWFDAKAAGWWVWGINCWIGGGFCSGNGPWVSVDGVFTKQDTGRGVNRKLPHLGDTGRGVNRQLPHLGGTGRGVNRQLFLTEWFAELRNRLHETRVACGDWSRVCGPSVLRASGGVCGVFLDPPYELNMRSAVYANESGCAADVRRWCAANGNAADLRIVLAGYDGEHNELERLGWRVHAWKATGGFGNQSNTTGRDNASKERLWFSPHCLDHQTQGILL